MIHKLFLKLSHNLHYGCIIYYMIYIVYVLVSKTISKSDQIP